MVVHRWGVSYIRHHLCRSIKTHLLRYANLNNKRNSAQLASTARFLWPLFHTAIKLVNDQPTSALRVYWIEGWQYLAI